MRVCVSGDRHWTDRQMIEKVIRVVFDPNRGDVLVHGDANGADSIAADYAYDKGWEIDPFPADWDRYHLSAGPRRNQEMVDSGLDLVLAFHSDLENSKGTKDMVTRARKAGIPVGVFS